MRVILIDDVVELGKRGEVVNVTQGYGRNYLIPQRLAVPATPGNLKQSEQQRAALARKEAKFKEDAEVLASELRQLHLVLSRKAGETGVLFGSVTAKDLSDLLSSHGVNLDRRRILLHQPLKTIGNATVEARPHSDVEVELLVSVLPEEGEAVEKVIKRGEESDQIQQDAEQRLELARQLVAQQTETDEQQEPAQAPANPED